VLRGALGDPSLTIGRWSPSASAYLDIEGQRVALPTDTDSRTVTRIDRDGVPHLALVHDMAWLDEIGLIESLGSAVRLAVRTADMQDELRVRGGDRASLPRGEVTFLFGDIEGSTALLESLGEPYGELLHGLRGVASSIAEAHGGRLVDASGDEVFLAFPEASAGVGAALELNQRLKATAWPGGAVVRVRVGLHTGRPEVTESGYVGLDVHRGARIMAIAHGGQILASAATVAGSDWSDSVTIRPLGLYALRGLSEPLALVEIESAEAGGAFPPPRGVRVG
jgi:class 3 adenylate cyclase